MRWVVLGVLLLLTGSARADQVKDALDQLEQRLREASICMAQRTAKHSCDEAERAAKIQAMRAVRDGATNVQVVTTIDMLKEENKGRDMISPYDCLLIERMFALKAARPFSFSTPIEPGRPMAGFIEETCNSVGSFCTSEHKKALACSAPEGERTRYQGEAEEEAQALVCKLPFLPPDWERRCTKADIRRVPPDTGTPSTKR